MNLNLENQGFKKLSYENQAEISAGASASFLTSLIPLIGSIFGNLGNISNAGISVFSSFQKNKLIEHIKNSNKGEIEFGKDGQFKIKWDNEKPLPSNNNSIIF